MRYESFPELWLLLRPDASQLLRAQCESMYVRLLTHPGSNLWHLSHKNQAGNLQRARERWTRCLELQPTHGTAKFNLATLTAELGDMTLGTKMFRSVAFGAWRLLFFRVVGGE